MTTVAEKRRNVPQAAPGRMLRHPQSVGRRHRALPARPRLQGAGLDQRRICLRAGAMPTARRRATMMLAHLRELCAATDVPVNADFEGGYADAPEGVAASVTLCVDTGVAGLSIEDFDRAITAIPLYDFDLALARVRAARAAIDKAGGDVLFTGRSEGFIRGRPDLDETIRRLKAYCRGRRRLPVRARHQDARADHRRGAGGGAQAGEFPDVGGDQLHRQRPRRDGRAPHQRRRNAGARGVDRVRPLGAARSRSKAGSTVSTARWRMPSSTPSSATT